MAAMIRIWGSVEDGELILIGQREVPAGTSSDDGMTQFIGALKDVTREFETLQQFDSIVSGMGEPG